MKLFIPLLAGTALLLAGCSKALDDERLVEDFPIPVRLTIAEARPITRTPVTVIDATNIGDVGIYGVTESSPGVFPWTTSPYIPNIAPTSINGTQLSFTPKLYYPMGGRRVMFYGYYPRTTATSGTHYITPPGIGIAPAYVFTLTGQEDIMHAVSTPSGSSSSAPVAFTFNHKLMQIQFNISLVSALLSGIKIVGVKNTGTLNIETGAISYGSGTTTISVTKSGTSTLPVMIPADVPSYNIEIAVLNILGGLLTYQRTVKPVSGNFLPGTIYTATIPLL